ncbi:MAG TPA: acetyl-CoA carboxylase carboxyl transferase subunit alpha, partial [Bacteroidota bacterium]
LLELGIIDRIVPEPLGGAHRNHQQAAAIVKETLIEELKNLEKMKPGKLIEKRIEKFSEMGFWEG